MTFEVRRLFGLGIALRGWNPTALSIASRLSPAGGARLFGLRQSLGTWSGQYRRREARTSRSSSVPFVCASSVPQAPPRPVP